MRERDHGRLETGNASETHPGPDRPSGIDLALPWRSCPIGKVRGESSQKARGGNPERKDQPRALHRQLAGQKNLTAPNERGRRRARKSARLSVSSPEAHVDVREEAPLQGDLPLREEPRQPEPSRLSRALKSLPKRFSISMFGVEVLTENHHAAFRHGRKRLRGYGVP